MILNSSLNKKTTYLTEENIVGTWIDGKPLYRRVFTGTVGVDNVIGTISNIATVTNLHGMINYNNTWCTIPTNNGDSDAIVIIFVNTAGGVQLYCKTTSSAYYNHPCNVTVEYTKTTD
ncbi:MAG: hypothetical protein PHP50_11015 [Lachnospiraceae bacterium]|nr:hypothetical protein [Lachnospiraceae bacterium]